MHTELTGQLAARRLERSRSDRLATGVCGGLARYFDLHPAFFRVGFVVLTLLGGAGILIYAAAALIIPDEGVDDSIAARVLRNHRDRPVALSAIAIAMVALFVLLSQARVHGSGLAWLLVLVAAAVVLWTERARTGMRVLASALAAFTTIAVVGVLVAIFALPVHLSNGIGDRAYYPASAGDLHRSYSLGVGDLRLDLAGLQLPPGQTRVSARVGVGQIDVVVPANVRVQVDGHARVGDVRVLGRRSDGAGVGVVVQTGRRDAARTLVLDLKVGAGDVHVRRP